MFHLPPLVGKLYNAFAHRNRRRAGIFLFAAVFYQSAEQVHLFERFFFHFAQADFRFGYPAARRIDFFDALVRFGQNAVQIIQLVDQIVYAPGFFHKRIQVRAQRVDGGGHFQRLLRTFAEPLFEFAQLVEGTVDAFDGLIEHDIFLFEPVVTHGNIAERFLKAPHFALKNL